MLLHLGGEWCRVLLLDSAYEPQLTPDNYCGLPTVGSWVMLQYVMVGNTQWKLHKAGGSWGNGR